MTGLTSSGVFVGCLRRLHRLNRRTEGSVFTTGACEILTVEYYWYYDRNSSKHHIIESGEPCIATAPEQQPTPAWQRHLHSNITPIKPYRSAMPNMCYHRIIIFKQCTVKDIRDYVRSEDTQQRHCNSTSHDRKRESISLEPPFIPTSPIKPNESSR